MSQKVTLGGDRLGSGKKQKVYIKGFERSNHDLRRILRTTMSAGTLVPTYCNLYLPGDKFSCDVSTKIQTLPTVGSLFGSFKFQTDFFMIPFRLYNGLLHANPVDIGLKMNQIKFPAMTLKTLISNPDLSIEDVNTSQISPSSLLSYLGLKGLGMTAFLNNESQSEVTKTINAVPLLGYWDIYKNYYANKQEEVGKYIGVENNLEYSAPLNFVIYGKNQIPTYGNYGEFTLEPVQNYTAQNGETTGFITKNSYPTSGPSGNTELPFLQDDNILITFSSDINLAYLKILWRKVGNNTINASSISDVGDYGISPVMDESNHGLLIQNNDLGNVIFVGLEYRSLENEAQKPTIETFNLENIDNMKMEILRNTGLNNQYSINEFTQYPYRAYVENTLQGKLKSKYKMFGLGLKTYNSDMFNNWLNKEQIDLVSQLSTIDVSGGDLTIDALNIQKKVYAMLTAISLSGNTYENWLEVVYDEQVYKRPESPIYIGGMSQEIEFTPVVSSAESEGANGKPQPLGTLGGRGVVSNIKGGKIEYTINEPCLIMAISSITPRIDYSQGNRFYLDIMSPNEFHKPHLDQIGFQDLLMERAAWFGRMKMSESGAYVNFAVGKTTPWIDYTTDYNEISGDLATNEMSFMTLNRNYELNKGLSGAERGSSPIQDFTTYIDPQKFNAAFANAKLDGQNFIVQIGFNVFARRKMSASQVPSV